MAKKPRPIARAELLSLAVTDVDAWGAQSFLRHRENVRHSRSRGER